MGVEKENRFRKYREPEYIKRFLWMFFAIIVMGVGLSFMFIADMGTDPMSTMNRGLAMVLPISYGNCQLLCNLVLLILVILFQRDQIGPGTIVNMVLIAYIAEYLEKVWKHTSLIGETPSMAIRVSMLLVGVTSFVIAAAVYMTAELGTAPFDAFVILVANRVPFSFRTVRITMDFSAVVIGWICGNTPGVMTILIVLTIGPVVSWFGKNLAVRLFHKETSFV